MHELLHLIHLNMISTDFSDYASGVKRLLSRPI